MKNFDLSAYLRDLETVVNIDSGQADEAGANAVAQFFKEKYEALGLKVDIRYFKDNKATPFMTVRNSDSERIDVLLAGHMDTVFAHGTAAERPFCIDEKGHVRGPGCIDCKGGLVSMYYLVKALMESGNVNFNFCVAMNSDEERRSDYSRDYWDELAQKSDRCFIFEPGRVNEEYVEQRKGGANYLVHCYGIPAHSGVNPEKGASAILELSRWVEELYKEFFKLEEGTTINIGRFDGGADNGSVPDYAEFTISLRCMTVERYLEIDRRLHEMEANPYDPRCRVVIDNLVVRPPMFPHEKTQELLAVMREVCAEMDYPFKTLSTGGGSDGNFIAHRGVATIDGCGPAGSNVHTPEEFMIVETVEKRIDVVYNTIRKIFG